MSILYAYLDHRTHTFINVKENIILYSACKPNHKKIDDLKKKMPINLQTPILLNTETNV